MPKLKQKLKTKKYQYLYLKHILNERWLYYYKADIIDSKNPYLVIEKKRLLHLSKWLDRVYMPIRIEIEKINA